MKDLNNSLLGRLKPVRCWYYEYYFPNNKVYMRDVKLHDMYQLMPNVRNTVFILRKKYEIIQLQVI